MLVEMVVVMIDLVMVVGVVVVIEVVVVFMINKLDKYVGGNFLVRINSTGSV